MQSRFPMPRRLGKVAVMESALEYDIALAALAWQVELGCAELIGDAPVDRFALEHAAREAAKMQAAAPAQASVSKSKNIPVPSAEPRIDAAAEARRAAQGCADLGALKSAMAAFEHCDLHRGARNLCFATGNPAARVMVIGEAPGREEDRSGAVYVGPAGRLLDKMLGAIDLSRDAQEPAQAAYLTYALPWRLPQARDAYATEIAAMAPFVQRHIEIVAPQLVLLLGEVAVHSVLGPKSAGGIGQGWAQAFGRPALAITAPDYLLSHPAGKRDAWRDLLMFKSRLAAL